MSDMLAALQAVKDVAKAFAPLATVGADIDRLSALVSHEDELKKSIETKLETLREYDVEMANKLAATDVAIAKRQKTQADAEAGYEKRLADLDAKYREARDAAAKVETDSEERIRAACAKADAEIASLTADLASERAALTASHNAFVEETKTKRAQIEHNTAIMEATLRELRSQAKGALDAVQEHTA